MQVGKAVSSTQLGMSSNKWDESLELEAFLEYPFLIKESVEFKNHLTGAQAYILYADLKEGCRADLPLTVKLHPQTPGLQDRVRSKEVREHYDLCSGTTEARRIMRDELDSRFFENSEVPSKVHTRPCYPYRPCYTPTIALGSVSPS